MNKLRMMLVNWLLGKDFLNGIDDIIELIFENRKRIIKLEHNLKALKNKIHK